MADNALFPQDVDSDKLGSLLEQHSVLHEAIRQADEGLEGERQVQELDRLTALVDANVTELTELVGGTRGLYALTHIAVEALATAAAKGLDLEADDGEAAKGLNALAFEGGRLADLAFTTLLTGGGGPAVFERKGFAPTEEG